MPLTRIQSPAISANAVTSTKIAEGAIVVADIADGSVTTAKLADANVTSTKIVTVANTQITGNIISSQITSVANTQITGNIISDQITSVANTQVTGIMLPANGGTGQSSLTANSVVIGNGTAAVQLVAPGTSGNILISDGTNWRSNTLTAAGVLSGELFVANRSTNTILGTSNSGYFLRYTSTFTQTLTAAATLGNGWRVFVQNVGTGVITFDPNGSETIGGTTTAVLNPGDMWLIACNGTNFDLLRLEGFNSVLYTSGVNSFTVPAGVYRIFGRVWGAGGGGVGFSSPGGGGGGYAEGWINVTPGSTVTATVGAAPGGTSNITVSSVIRIQATGGGYAAGGVGSGTDATFYATGGSGAANYEGSYNTAIGGMGALGGGGGAYSQSQGSAPTAGQFPGGGGAGTSAPGGSGAVKLEWK